MTKRRLLLALALFAGVCLMALLGRLLRPAQFTEEMANRILPGMTEADVVAILGRRSGDYSTIDELYLPGPDDYRSNVWLTPELLQYPDGTYEKAWVSDHGGVAVEFNAEGRVCRAYFDGPYWTPDIRTPLDFFRRLKRLVVK
jgi:hypothetical protein